MTEESVTLAMMWSKMQEMHMETYTEMKMMHTKMDTYLQRLEKIENNYRNLETRVFNIENDDYITQTELAGVQQQIKDSNDAIYDEIKEQCDRIRRQNNIVVMGVPENENGSKLLQSLLDTIVDNKGHVVMQERIGKINASQKYPRPVRVVLSNSLIKKQTLRNCKALKGLAEFEKVSVRPDKTKQQQLHVSPMQTRAKRRRIESEDQNVQERGSSSTSPDRMD